MNDSIYVISVSFMLIFLGGLTFHRMTSKRTPEGARALLRPSGRLALMGVLLTAAYVSAARNEVKVTNYLAQQLLGTR